MPGSQRGRRENEKAGRGDGPVRLERGGLGTGGQASESRPIPDGAFLKPVSGGKSKAGRPHLPHAARVDILIISSVNAPATGGPNRRNPLLGRRLRQEFACGKWCVNTQAWLVIQTV